MKLIALLFVVSTTLSEEIRVNDTNGYIDQTNWNEQTIQGEDLGNVQNITNEPRIITERVTAPPKVLTERITADPKIITENIEMPVKQLIITQPTQLTENFRAVPQFIRQSGRMENRDPVTRETIFT